MRNVFFFSLLMVALLSISSVQAPFTELFIYNDLLSPVSDDLTSYNTYWNSWTNSTAGTNIGITHNISASAGQKVSFTRSAGNYPDNNSLLTDDFSDDELGNWTYYTTALQPGGSSPMPPLNNSNDDLLMVESGGLFSFVYTADANEQCSYVHAITQTSNDTTITLEFTLSCDIVTEGDSVEFYVSLPVTNEEEFDTGMWWQFILDGVNDYVRCVESVNASGNIIYTGAAWDGIEDSTTYKLVVNDGGTTFAYIDDIEVGNITTDPIIIASLFRAVVISGADASTDTSISASFHSLFVNQDESSSYRYTSNYYSIYRRQVTDPGIEFAGYTTATTGTRTSLIQSIGLTVENSGNLSQFIGLQMNFATDTIAIKYAVYINGTLTTNTSSTIAFAGDWRLKIDNKGATIDVTATSGVNEVTVSDIIPASNFRYVVIAFTTASIDVTAVTAVMESLTATFAATWNYDYDLNEPDAGTINATDFSVTAERNNDGQIRLTKISPQFKAFSGIWRATLDLDEDDYFQQFISVSEWSTHRTEGGIPVPEQTMVLYIFVSNDGETDYFICQLYSLTYVYGVGLELYGSFAANIAPATTSIEFSYRFYVTKDLIIADVLAIIDDVETKVTGSISRAVTSSDYFALTQEFVYDSAHTATEVQITHHSLTFTEFSTTYTVPELLIPTAISSGPAARGLFEWLADMIIGGLGGFFTWIFSGIAKIFSPLIDWALDLLDALIDFLWTLVTDIILAILDALYDWLVSIGLGDPVDGFLDFLDVIITTVLATIGFLIALMESDNIKIVMLIVFIYMCVLPFATHETGEALGVIFERAGFNILIIQPFGCKLPAGFIVIPYFFLFIINLW